LLFGEKVGFSISQCQADEEFKDSLHTAILFTQGLYAIIEAGASNAMYKIYCRFEGGSQILKRCDVTWKRKEMAEREIGWTTVGWPAGVEDFEALYPE
jgi:hypothetical protein